MYIYVTYLYIHVHVCVCVLSHVWLAVTPWTVAHQTPLPMRVSRQDYWSGCHFLLEGIFLTQSSNLHLLLLMHQQVISLPQYQASLVAQMVKSLPAMWETQVRSLAREDPLEKEMATHSSTLQKTHGRSSLVWNRLRDLTFPFPLPSGKSSVCVCTDNMCIYTDTDDMCVYNLKYEGKSTRGVLASGNIMWTTEAVVNF